MVTCLQKSVWPVERFPAGPVDKCELMNPAELPTTLEAAHQLIQQLQWRVAQLDFLPALSWVEIELATEEQNTDAVILKAPKATGVGFEALDFRV